MDASNMEIVKLLTIDQIAHRWSLSAKTIRRLIWDGKLRSSPIRRAVRLALKEVERFEQALGA